MKCGKYIFVNNFFIHVVLIVNKHVVNKVIIITCMMLVTYLNILTVKSKLPVIILLKMKHV